jgi:hypothetical protein
VNARRKILEIILAEGKKPPTRAWMRRHLSLQISRYGTFAVTANPQWAAEIKARAARRIGELSRALAKAKHGTKRGGKRGGNETQQSGVSKRDASKQAGLSEQAARRD